MSRKMFVGEILCMLHIVAKKQYFSQGDWASYKLQKRRLFNISFVNYRPV